MKTTTSATPSEALGPVPQPGTLLEYVLYEPRDGLADDAARRSYVDQARAVYVGLAAGYVDGARRAALERGTGGNDVPTILVPFGNTQVDLPLDPDQLLEALTIVYAVEGWKGVRRVSDALDANLKRGLSPPAPDRDRYGTRAGDPALAPRNQASDVSGVPEVFDFSRLPGALQSSDITVQEAERERWQRGKDTFDAARDLLAVAVLNALERIERLATDLCVAGLNRGRDQAAKFWHQYDAEKLHVGTQHSWLNPTAIYKYTLKEKAERESLKQALKPLVAQLAEIGRLEELYERALSRGGAEGGSGSDAEPAPEPEQLTKQLDAAGAAFARQLNASRAKHPIVAALMLALEPGFDVDESGQQSALDERAVTLLDTMITAAEKFNPPASRVATLSRTPDNWPAALYQGPEQWLADKLFLNRVQLEPLTHEPLLAQLLAGEDAELDAFQYVVLMQYLNALGDRPEMARREAQELGAAGAKAARVARDLGFVNIALNVAAVFVPPLRPVAAILDTALIVYGAVTTANAALELDTTFRTAVQEQLLAVSKGASISDLTELGEVIANAPSSEGLGLMLLQAGVSLRVTASTLRLFPTRRLDFLQKLDIVLSLP